MIIELMVEGMSAWTLDDGGDRERVVVDMDGVTGVLLASSLIGTVRAVRNMPGAPKCDSCGQLLPASERGSVNDQFKRGPVDGERGSTLLPGQPEDGTDVDLPVQDR